MGLKVAKLTIKQFVMSVGILVMAVSISGCLAGVPGTGGGAESGDGQAAASGQAPGSCPVDTQPFTAPDERFGFCLAPGWDYEEGFMGSVVMVAPETVPPDGITANVNVIAEPLAEDEDLHTIRQDLIDTLPLMLTDFRLLEEGEAKLGDAKALEFVYQARQGIYTLTFHQLVAVHEEAAYVWTYTMPDVDHLDDPEVDSMHASFAFL